MSIKLKDNCITVCSECFDIKKILESGQVFRYEEAAGYFILSAGCECAKIVCCGAENKIFCTNIDFFYNFFDFSIEYDIILNKLKKDSILHYAVTYGRGIRMLKQQKLETVISFIISANNNIKRISRTLKKLCFDNGERREFEGVTYYAFPALKILKTLDEQYFKKIGAGYRSGYLVKTIRAIDDGTLESIERLETAKAREELRKFCGVGRKVADCVLLFAYNRLDVFPVDTWIEKVYVGEYGGNAISREKISAELVNKYGNLSGYAQQYLFYWKRKK